MTKHDKNSNDEESKSSKLHEELIEAKELVSKLKNTLENETRIRQYYVEKCIQLKKNAKELEFDLDAFGGYLLMTRTPMHVINEFRKINRD